jgi:hypothetical protein
MGVLHADMTAETKDKVKHDELTRVLKMMAKEIRELKIRVKVLEDKK